MEGTIVMNAKKKKKDKLNLAYLVDELDRVDQVVLPSAVQKTVEKKKEKAVKNEDNESNDDWLDTILNFKTPKPKKKKKNSFKGFTVEEKKKNEKKKKNNGEPLNYRKEFETELATLHNILVDQSKFTDSLQKQYNEIEKSKSSSRGIGKFTSDLINSITQARGTELQIVKETINTKKSIADLNMKEREKFGKKIGEGSENNAAYASTFLNQVMKAGRSNIVDGGYSPDGAGEYSSFDENDDELINALSENLGDNSRAPEVDKYLKYENQNVKIVIEMNEMDYSDYRFVAIDENNNEIFDYPLPDKTKISVNRSTERGVDAYGQKFDIIFV